MCVHDDNNGLIVRNGYGGAGESATDDKFARPRPLRAYIIQTACCTRIIWLGSRTFYDSVLRFIGKITYRNCFVTQRRPKPADLSTYSVRNRATFIKRFS